MAVKRKPKEAEVIRSMAEFCERYLPNGCATPEDELDPAQAGPALVERAMKDFRKHLKASSRECSAAQ
ncbi:MAG: hypothetical protein KBI47_14605 [Armatimonadetes bacterium]|nr:hypothetical protein [Armatimonadota bacterium]MDI9585407.1 hypothetical protein [Acidobacteriota bacterium]